MIDPDSWLLVATLVEECIYVRQFFLYEKKDVMIDRWAVYRKTAVVWSFLEMVGATRVLHSPEEKYSESVIRSATCHHVSLLKYLLSHQLWVQVGNGKNTKEKEKKRSRVSLPWIWTAAQIQESELELERPAAVAPPNTSDSSRHRTTEGQAAGCSYSQETLPCHAKHNGNRSFLCCVVFVSRRCRGYLGR